MIDIKETKLFHGKPLQKKSPQTLFFIIELLQIFVRIAVRLYTMYLVHAEKDSNSAMNVM